MSFDPMREQLKRLAERLQKDDLKLIIGGGYGLILKGEYIRKNEIKTIFADLPEDRSTRDIDVFFSAEIITDSDKIEKVRDALHYFGAEPVANYFQFEIAVAEESVKSKVKIDLLAPPVDEEDRKLVHIKNFRIRPKNAQKIHGYLTEEAITIEEKLISINIGEEEPIEIFLPHPFSYLILKLFALRDLRDEEDKDLGAHHAFDIYRIYGMMSEEEFREAVELSVKYSDHPKIKETAQIVNELFASTDSIGVARIRQHANQNDVEIVDEYISGIVRDLKHLFSKS